MNNAHDVALNSGSIDPAGYDDNELHEQLERYVKAEVYKAFAGYQMADIEDAMQDAWVQVYSNRRFYDSSKGTLTTYYAYTIKHSNACRKNKLCYGEISDHFAANANIVKQTMSALAKDGLHPSPEVIAARSGLSLASVMDALATIKGARTVDLDAIMDCGQDDASLYAQSAEHYYFNDMYARDTVRTSLDNLDYLTRTAIRMRYGIGGPPKSYNDIAAELDVKTDDVKHMITRGLRVLGSDPSLIALNKDILG